MKICDFLLVLVALAIAGFALGHSLGTNDTVSKQKKKIEQLTERVQLLESALSDKSGIKK